MGFSYLGSKIVILIVSPHMDDEVLGCSSWLDKDAHVFYTTRNHPDQGNLVAEENAKLQLEVGFSVSWSKFDRINELDQVGQISIISEIESLLDRIQPDVLLLPAPSYNQDHRACYEAGLTAARPHYHNWFVPGVLIYEEPETLGAMRKPDAFRPQYFRDVDIERKLHLYEIYKSQVKSHRSKKHIVALAEIRGAVSNKEFAEAFEVARWVT